MDSPWLLFLHGINASTDEAWLDPINAAITWFGYEAFPYERILTPDYRAALRGGGVATLVTSSVAKPSPTVWKRPPKDEWRRAKSDYLARMASLDARLRPLVNANVPVIRPPEVAMIPPIPLLIDDARRYARSRDVRARVRDIVLDSLEQVPKGCRIVIVAHSLGSVIAANLIKSLPNNLVVSALITIGSPLGSVSEFRSRELDDFPFDRLKAWVNVFEPRDPVTGSRGVCEYYRWAIDIPVTLQDWLPPVLFHQHGAQYYCGHPVIGSAIAGALVGSGLATLEPGQSVEGLELLLLQSLHLRELAKQLPTNDSDRTASFESARQQTAVEHASAARLIHERNPSTAALPETEFLQRPDAHIRGAWDDRTLLALAIMLASGPPAPPFQVEEDVDAEERKMALIATLSLIRGLRAEPTEIDIVDAIFSTRPAIRDFLSPGRPWVPQALLTVGALTLAATGVGIAVVAPAGLAGAALITSTLAAFGPGGMIGGMATLAALAGAGSAMAAVGAALGVTGVTRATTDLLTNALDEATATQDPETLRSLLIALLTLVATQERLEFPTQRAHMYLACASALGRLHRQVEAHESIDSKSKATKAVKEMRALLAKACSWLLGEEKPESREASEWNRMSTAYSRAIDGRLDFLSEVLSGPGWVHQAPPTLEGPGQRP